MKRLIVGVVAAVILTTGQAAAEGLGPPSRIKAPGTVIGPNWNGVYVGVGIGAGVASHDVSGKKEKKYCKTWWCGHCLEWEHYTESFSDSDTSDIGVFGTVTVGLDRVLRPGWVGGVFADYDFGSNISGDVSLPHYSLSLDHKSSWAVGARLGYLVTPSTLLYGTAGYTQAQFDIGNLGSTTFDGYFVGAGIETFLRQNWTLKLEYRFSQFGEETILDSHHISADLEPSMHTARLILSYRFGHHD